MIDLKRGVFIKQPLHKATEFASKLLAHLSAICWSSLVHERLFSHMTLLLTPRGGAVVASFVIVFAHHY